MAANDLTKSLDAIWVDARQEFLDKAKVDIGNGVGRSGVFPDASDSLMNRLLERDRAAPQTNPDKARAAQVVGDVMKLLQLVGGLAATAAATVFSPAGMCFNAVNFLIDGVSRMKKFHADIASLFTSIKAILTRFKMLQRIEDTYVRVEGQQRLPSELILTTTKMMASFVRICLLAHKQMLRGTFKSAMVDIRVAFTEDDGGVQGELQKLEGLIKEQDSIKGTITLEEVMKSRADIGKVIESASRQEIELRKTYQVASATFGVATDTLEAASETNRIVSASHRQDVDTKRLKSIADKLKIGSNSQSEILPMVREQVERLNEIRNQRIPGTGNWLRENEDYIEWRSGQGYPLLCMQGHKDTGKSVLVSRVIDECISDNESGSRVSLAYYFFGERKDRRDTNDKTEAIEQTKPIAAALRCIAYQLAQDNALYAKKLDVALQDGKFETDPSRMSPKALLDKLLLGKAHPTAMYIIFDGLDQVTGAQGFIRELCHLEGNNLTSGVEVKEDREGDTLQARLNHTRFLVTIDPEKCPVGKRAQMSFLHLANRDSIAQRADDARNVQDLELFIDNKLDDGSSLLGPHLKNDPKLLSRFKEKLLVICDGKYSPIENRLRLVNQCIVEREPKDMSDLEEVMFSDEVDDLGTLLRPIMLEFEARLPAADIAQVNNILAWLMYGVAGGSLTLEEADAVASLEKNSSVLMKFSQKLRAKEELYNSIFKVETELDRTTISIQEDLMEWLRKNDAVAMGPTSVPRAACKPTISMTITFEQAELKSVRRFLWDLHEKLTYDKSFFAVAGSEIHSKGKIRVNKIEAVSKLLTQFLNLLLEDTNPEKSTDALRGLAFDQLPSLVKDAQGLAGPSFPELNAIITKLAAFLSSDSIVDLMKECVMKESLASFNWLSSRKLVAAMDALVSREKLSGLLPEQRRTLKLLLDKADGGFGTSLYYFTSQIGRMWLLEDSWPENSVMDPLLAAYFWVDDFLILRREWKEWSNAKPSANPKVSFVGPEKASEDLQNSKSALVPASFGAPVGSESEVEPPNSAEPEDVQALKRQDTLGLPLTLTRPESIQESEESEGSDPPLPNIESRITQAFEWLQTQFSRLGIAKNEGLMLERLGVTYLQFDAPSKAIETLIKALEVSENPARVHRRLAQAYKEHDKFDKALKHANQALSHYPKVSSVDSKEVRAVKNLLGKIYQRSKQPHEAMRVFEEMLDADPHDWGVYKDLLAISYEQQSTEKIKEIFDSLDRLQLPYGPESVETSGFVLLLIFAISADTTDASLLTHAKSADRLDKLLQSLQETLKVLGRGQTNEEPSSASIQAASVHLQQGWATALIDPDETEHHKAYELWRQAIKIVPTGDQGWKCFSVRYRAAEAASNYHYSQIMTHGRPPAAHLKKIKEIMEESRTEPQINPILAHAYASSGQPKMAKALLRNDLREVLELLEDDDIENDWEAFSGLTVHLRHCGDTANTLAACSLIHPKLDKHEENQDVEDSLTSDSDTPKPADHDEESSPHSSGLAQSQSGDSVKQGAEEDILVNGHADMPPSDTNPSPEKNGALKGPMLMLCDGCDLTWTYPNDYWECEVCWSVAFCPDCYTKFQQGRLDKWVCHKSHSFYYVPPWTWEEYRRIPKDSVCIPKQLEDGQWSREQGEIITIDEWVKRIKKDWDLQ